METTQTTTQDEAHINIFIPMTIKRRGGNVPTIIAPKNKALENTENSYDYNLINAIVKAYRLQKKLDKNPTMTIAELATKEGLTKGYVGRLMRLNLLAPDIVEAILFGKQPRELKLQDLLRNEIPHIWQEQREKFGFI